MSAESAQSTAEATVLLARRDATANALDLLRSGWFVLRIRQLVLIGLLGMSRTDRGAAARSVELLLG